METYSRKGIFLDAICDGEACDLEPITREEVMLKRLVERTGGSGGSGSSGGSGGGVMYVNFTFKEPVNASVAYFTADKTYFEVLEAYRNGQYVCGRIIGTTDEMGYEKLFPLNYITYNSEAAHPEDNLAEFVDTMYCGGDMMSQQRFMMRATGVVTTTYYTYDLRPSNYDYT